MRIRARDETAALPGRIDDMRQIGSAQKQFIGVVEKQRRTHAIDETIEGGSRRLDDYKRTRRHARDNFTRRALSQLSIAALKNQERRECCDIVRSAEQWAR